MPSDSHFSPFPPRSRLATWRPPLILAADAAIACVALWLAYQLRFDDPSPFTADLPVLALALCVVRMLVNYAFHLHFWSFKFSSLRDAARLGIAGVVGTLLFVAVSFFLLRNSLEALPARGVVVLEMLLSIAGMAALRFGPRLLFTYRADLMPRRRLGAARTLIAGAGSAGELLLRDLQRQDEARLHVVGFVDDNPAKWGQIVGGKPVLGGLDDLPRFIERHRVQRVVIAIRAIDPVRLRDVLTRDTPQPVRFQILPPGHGALDEQNAADALRDVAPQDLLVREVVTFDHAAAGDSLAAGPWLLVAGAAGSIGSEVCRQLLEVGARRLVLLDTDENGLYVLLRRFQRAFPDREILAEVADIRDRPRLDRLFARYRPRDVFHAAARKHVPLMEAAPCEAIKTNVLGTLHLAEVAEAYGVERFVYTSTDKAVRPTNVMGATKRLGEHLLRALDERSRTSFLSVRFGNVLDSAGSVVPLFREQIAAGGPVTVTDPRVERFFMTISEAVGLVLRAAYGGYGRLCVLEMGEPVRIEELARQMIVRAGLVPDVDVRIEYCGLRPGEKLFEELLGDGETVIRSIDGKIRVVDSPAPGVDLAVGLDGLAAAVGRDDSAAAVAQLARLVPEYARSREVLAVSPAGPVASVPVAPLPSAPLPVVDASLEDDDDTLVM